MIAISAAQSEEKDNKTRHEGKQYKVLRGFHSEKRKQPEIDPEGIEPEKRQENRISEKRMDKVRVVGM